MKPTVKSFGRVSTGVICVLDMQGGKPGGHFGRENVAPTLTKGRASVNDIHVVCRMGNAEES